MAITARIMGPVGSSMEGPQDVDFTHLPCIGDVVKVEWDGHTAREVYLVEHIIHHVTFGPGGRQAAAPVTIEVSAVPESQAASMNLEVS